MFINNLIINYERFDYSFIDKDYNIKYSVNVTDWMSKPDLLPLKNNFDELFKGFLETPGRIPQPSYNFYVNYDFIYESSFNYNTL